jgi:hypothetical protein
MTAPAHSFAHRFAVNAEAQLKSGSTWAAGAFAVLIGVVAAWPDLGNAIDMIPGLHGYGLPLAGFVVVLGAKFRPSGAMTSQTQAMVAEIARLRMNEWLRAHGAPEIPAPAATALPPIPLPVVPAVPAAALHARATAPLKAARAAAAPATATKPSASDQVLDMLADAIARRQADISLDFDDGGVHP